MEQDLTSSDILSYLKKRHLQVTQLEGLPYNQLEKIYLNFAVPQPRREPRHRSRATATAKLATAPSHMNLTMEVEQLAQRIQSAAMLGQKRPMPMEKPNADDKVKQIKMDLD